MLSPLVVPSPRTVVGARQSVFVAVLAAWMGLGSLGMRAADGLILTPWGTLGGLIVRDERVTFEGGVRIVPPDGAGFRGAVKYLQRPKYEPGDEVRRVTSAIDGVPFQVSVRDTGRGEAVVEVECSVTNAHALSDAVFYAFDVPPEFGVTAGAWLLAGGGEAVADLETQAPWGAGRTAVGFRWAGEGRQLEFRSAEPMEMILRRERSDRPTSLNDPSVRQVFLPDDGTPRGVQVYVRLLPAPAAAGASGRGRFTVRATAERQRQAVRLTLDPKRAGRPFEGIGGNFRLQFPQTDEAVVTYNLANLPVRWGRVAMPWAEWDPEESADPLERARGGHLHREVASAMAMAQRLEREGIPVMVGAWVPPRWAESPDEPEGMRGVALNQAKLERIAHSLVTYLVHLKEAYGVEARYFSLNEPEIGVEVRQTPAEHVEYLRSVGRALARSGLLTRLLLGDTAHGTDRALDFVRPAVADPEVPRYLGGLAFHTWRGCLPETMARWAGVARELGVPLLVTEGGPDAHVHEYPEAMLEPWFQLDAIDLYLRIGAHGQPAAFLEWQLTTDYSVVWGGGVYGTVGPLRPTQRFWNLLQLGTVAPGSAWIPVAGQAPDLTVAAVGALARGEWAVHLVNRSGPREVILGGWPEGVRQVRGVVTDDRRGMKSLGRWRAHEGEVRLTLPGQSYVTVMGGLWK